MNKKVLSESDICDEFIRPSIEAAGWDGMLQIYREYPLRPGRAVVRGRKAKLISAPIAVPPLEEQRRIVARVTELRRPCATVRQRLADACATQSRLSDALVEQALA